LSYRPSATTLPRMVVALALLAFLAPTAAVYVSHRLAQRTRLQIAEDSAKKVEAVQETVNGNTDALLDRISKLEGLLAAAQA
jgi:hypothetical protein